MGLNLILIGSDQGSYTPTNGARTIVMAGLDFPPTIEQMAYVYNKTQDTLYYAPMEGLAKCTISGTTITISTDFAVLVTGDEIHIQFWLPQTAYDLPQDAGKFIMENVLTQQSPQNLVSASDIGAVNDTWIDQGNELDVENEDDILLFVNFTVNDSTGNYFKILLKYENGGTDEYEQEHLSSYQKTIGDASVKRAYLFGVTNVVSIQVQSKATLIGATEGTLTIDIVKK